MAQRPSILLSKDTVALIKQRYAARGEKLTSSDDLAKGAKVTAADKRTVDAVVGASVESRASAWNRLTVKAALSQGEQDVKISLGMFGTPEQYKLAQTRLESRAALDAARDEAEAANSRVSRFYEVDDEAKRQSYDRIPERTKWAIAARMPTPGSSAIPSFDDSARRARAVKIDQRTAEAEQVNRDFADQPLGSSANSIWDEFVSDVSWAKGRGISTGGTLLNSSNLSAKRAGRSPSFYGTGTY